MRAVLCVLILLYCPVSSSAGDETPPDDDLPSAELLEFLGDLEPMDEETWDLLEHHALRDAAQRKQGDSQ